jgi:oligosaccharide repeat unit polymerase
MLILAIIVFGLLLLIAHSRARNLLFPPELFAALWLVSLVGLLASGDTFYPVPAEAYLVYVLGGVAFVFGGILVFELSANLAQPAGTQGTRSPSPRTLIALDVCLAILVIGLPFYWRELTESIDAEGIMVLNAIRVAAVEASDTGRTFSVLLNLNVLAQFTAMVMYFEMNGDPARALRALAAIVLALIYGVMDGSKTTVVVLVLSLAFISSLKARRFKVSNFVAAVTVSLSLFALGLLTITFIFADLGSSGETIAELAHTVQQYWLGGLVTFGAIALNRNVIPTVQPLDRFFLETARSLGIHIDVPPRHAEYLPTNSLAETNVHTIYSTYFKDHGWLGVLVLMFLLGAALSVVYKRAMRGRTIALLVFAQLEIGVLYTIYAESFTTSVNRYIKFVVFLLFLYRTLPATGRRGHHVTLEAERAEPAI